MRVRYIGPLPRREVAGVAFERGEVVEVTDSLVRRLISRLNGFEEVRRGRPRKVKANDEDGASGSDAGIPAGGRS